ncbi:uncharacterized protein E5676_scaffold2119G00480 [Cucumis melo var. makuwa]|uniref:Uncharacterized protein n=1 Tax=Cucumis melo var. makuwa TaxID=1194695 RepID=A0A5A7VJX6_CUCMM|nr:uncharacterized protein E6C27_scaffold979G00990 [Cucumis melo var. makuwa]TYK04110.1 uncharacterized protein E5676_scaffold2119G00480 [Cucumis melo var. makuwa]
MSNKVGGSGKEKCQAVTLRSNLTISKQKSKRRNCGRLKKKGDDQQIFKFLYVLNQLHINIPFVETVALTQATNVIFKNGVPEKMTDLGSFTVLCSIGGMDLSRALCDLRASINLMPLSIFKKLDIWKV